MQEKKNKQLAVLLVVLSCITAVVYYSGNADNVTVDKSRFRDYDLTTADQIVLESGKGKVDLKFNGTKWILNSRFDADASMVEVLFATLQQVEVKRPLASSIRDSVCTELKERGIKVSVLSSGKMLSSFFAGGNLKKSQAYFCVAEDEMETYIVAIPGYRVYVSGIFEVPEKDWKSKIVFGFNWRNFKSLEAQFPQQQQDNFEIGFRDNYFAVNGLAPVDTARINNFLDDVSLLTVDEYLEGPALQDTLSKAPPEMIVLIKDIGQREYSLKLYRPKPDGMVPGLINGADWALFDGRKALKIVKPRNYFKGTGTR